MHTQWLHDHFGRCRYFFKKLGDVKVFIIWFECSVLNCFFVQKVLKLAEQYLLRDLDLFYHFEVSGIFNLMTQLINNSLSVLNWFY